MHFSRCEAGNLSREFPALASQESSESLLADARPAYSLRSTSAPWRPDQPGVPHMTRQIKLAILLVAMALALSGFARAQRDADDDYYGQRTDGGQARQYGYQNGYHDGVKHGRHEGRENDPEDFRLPDDGQARRGSRDWMGPIWVYQNAYRDGYRAGFRAGYNNESRAWGDRDGDSGGPWFGNRAHQIGFQDGASVAREDAARGKPYNPRPRGRYDDEDHGYSSAYGNKGAYKTQYANGYRAGYESARGRY